jgi:F0F1-type ATP synthase assembly protein I
VKQVPSQVHGQGQPQDQATYAESTARALRTSLRAQTVVAMGLSLGLLAVGKVAAYSAFFGSLTAYLPGVFFTVLVGRRIGAGSAAFLGTAALAELGKLLMMGLLCALVFICVRPLAPGWFFTGMMALLVSNWIGLARAIR